MQRKLRVNYIANLAYQLFSVIAPLITTPYVARVLQADGVGLYSYTYSIATGFVAVAQFGTVAYGQRQIAYNRDNVLERSRIFYNVFLLRLLTTAAALGVYFLIFSRSDQFEMFALQSLCIFAVAVDISWFFQGMEDFGTIAVRDVCTKIVSILCVFLFVKEKEDVTLYTFILAAAIIAGRLTSWALAGKYLCRVPWKKIHIFENFKDILYLFAPQIASQLYAIIDKSMIGLMTTTTYESGYYQQADRIVKLCLAVATCAVTVMFPRISELYARQDFDRIRDLTRKTFRFVWMLCLPMGVGMFLLIDMVVPWFLGSGYEGVTILVRILSVHFVLVSINSVIGSLLMVAQMRQSQHAACVTVITVCNIILNAILIPRFLAVGAAIASVAAEAIGVGLQLYFVRKEYSVATLAKWMVPYLLPTGGMLVAILICKPYLPASVPGVCVLIGLGVLVYGLLLLVTREQLFMENMKLLTGKLRGKGKKHNR